MESFPSGPPSKYTNNSTTESQIANLLSGEGSSKEVLSQSEIMVAAKFPVVSSVIF